MTVKQLIEKLEKFDPNAKVLIVDDICEYRNNFTVEEEFNNVAIVLNEED